MKKSGFCIELNEDVCTLRGGSLKSEIYCWLSETVGGGKWHAIHTNKGTIKFFFGDDDHAALFKLAWGGE